MNLPGAWDADMSWAPTAAIAAVAAAAAVAAIPMFEVVAWLFIVIVVVLNVNKKLVDEK